MLTNEDGDTLKCASAEFVLAEDNATARAERRRLKGKQVANNGKGNQGQQGKVLQDQNFINIMVASADFQTDDGVLANAEGDVLLTGSADFETTGGVLADSKGAPLLTMASGLQVGGGALVQPAPALSETDIDFSAEINEAVAAMGGGRRLKSAAGVDTAGAEGGVGGRRRLVSSHLNDLLSGKVGRAAASSVKLKQRSGAPAM